MKEKAETSKYRDWCYEQGMFTQQCMMNALSINKRKASRLCILFISDGTIEFNSFERKTSNRKGYCRSVYKSAIKPKTHYFMKMNYVSKRKMPTSKIESPMLYIKNGEPLAVLVPIEQYVNLTE